MSESKHTPGRWRATAQYGEDSREPYMVWSDDRGAAIAHIFSRSESGLANRDEQKANAALIAAAPELLEHCRTMLSWWEKNPDVLKRFPTLAIDEIRAAIRKAEGGAA